MKKKNKMIVGQVLEYFAIFIWLFIFCYGVYVKSILLVLVWLLFTTLTLLTTVHNMSK